MDALIIANGTLPGKHVMQFLFRRPVRVVCADGGANSARRLRITPDIILGDFDSITKATKNHYRNVKMHQITDQESTDLEKAIDYCINHRIKIVDIVGATGTRIDHVTGALGCFKKYRNKIILRFHDTIGVITFVDRQTTLDTKVGEKISLIPLERCEGVTTQHLQYPLKNDILELGVREGISNSATETKVTISVRKGILLLYRFNKLA